MNNYNHLYSKILKYYDSDIESNKELKEYVKVHGVDTLVRLLLNSKYGLSSSIDLEELEIELQSIVALWNNIRSSFEDFTCEGCAVIENDEITCVGVHCLTCPFRDVGNIHNIINLLHIVEEMNKNG